MKDNEVLSIETASKHEILTCSQMLFCALSLQLLLMSTFRRHRELKTVSGSKRCKCLLQLIPVLASSWGTLTLAQPQANILGKSKCFGIISLWPQGENLLLFQVLVSVLHPNTPLAVFTMPRRATLCQVCKV